MFASIQVLSESFVLYILLSKTITANGNNSRNSLIAVNLSRHLVVHTFLEILICQSD